VTAIEQKASKEAETWKEVKKLGYKRVRSRQFVGADALHKSNSNN
jgi:hypothetical protein